MPPQALHQPVSSATIIRVLLVALIVMSLLAGYYAAQLKLLERRWTELNQTVYNSNTK